ncbi:protein-disulfide reductase DsbD domain-containing protein [Roseibium sp.]|uniref:protein-disulfide reductase DsbD domain-containing protein n=1 Tax=Roseibium sp. TaxID=1936156 RepID=UPI003BB1A6FA
MKILTAIFVALVSLLPAAALAAMTDWTEVKGGAVRLIAAGPSEGGHYLAGLEFLLEPGWHTYWRHPGESGIPPQISFQGSSNLKAVEVLYPTPKRYSDGFSESIVYHDGIVLPLRIEAEDAARPVSVSMDLFFGVCSDICVPGDATMTLELRPQSERDALAERLIERDLDTVPTPQGSAGHEQLRVTSVALDPSGSLRIEAETGGAAEPDLFAAGPEGSFIGLPKPADDPNGTSVWTLSTKGLATTREDQTLRLVLTAGDQAVEHLVPIHPDWVR